MSEMTTLENGIRIITDYVPTVESVAIGAWFAVGARDESANENGIAHMVEHMMFKGTPTRNARAIAEEIENVGGHVNAFTSREMTAYYMHLLKEDMPLAVDVLADILQNSLFDEQELERERQVILQEIGMVQDTPDDLVFDNVQEAAFPAQSVGAPILGRPEIIAALQRENLDGYVRKRYTPQRMVISAAGNIRHDLLVSLVAERFNAMREDQEMPRQKSRYTGGEHRLQKELEQSHVIIGFEGISQTRREYDTAQIFSTILGGGMSSRLFQEIREKRGLVYSVYSFHMGISDSGLFGIYAGTGPENLSELIPVACDEIAKAAQQVTEDELIRAKTQMKADILMNREKMMSRANQQAKHLIYFDKLYDPEEKIRSIDRIDTEQVKDVATRLLGSSPVLAALGPLDQLESYDKMKKRIAS